MSVLSLVLGAVQSRASAQPQPQLARLEYHGLMGTWACMGADDGGSALTATMTLRFNDGGAFYLTIDPKPVTAKHARISETWEWDTAGGVWRAIPDAGSAEQAQFTTSGWAGHTMTSVRMAAQSTMQRVFVRTRPNHLTFRSERALLQPDDAPAREHAFYHLACKRIVNDAPR